jgi:hypothetical protein
MPSAAIVVSSGAQAVLTQAVLTQAMLTQAMRWLRRDWPDPGRNRSPA